MRTVRPLFQMICWWCRNPIRSKLGEDFARKTLRSMPDVTHLKIGHEGEGFRPVLPAYLPEMVVWVCPSVRLFI